MWLVTCITCALIIFMCLGNQWHNGYWASFKGSGILSSLLSLLLKPTAKQIISEDSKYAKCRRIFHLYILRSCCHQMGLLLGKAKANHAIASKTSLRTQADTFGENHLKCFGCPHLGVVGPMCPTSKLRDLCSSWTTSQRWGPSNCTVSLQHT